MEILVLDSNFITLDILETFNSTIWTDRYFACGDFEIHTSVNSRNLNLLQKDQYLWSNGSEHVMIIEDIEIDTDIENGNYLTVTGRSLESILDRRIIWAQTVLSGNFQSGIERLLNENIINPTNPSRKIDNFIFEASTDPLITALTLEAQFNGENLYDVVQKLCQTNNIGFKVILTDANMFKFVLYSGVDRSYDQLTNPYVVFSPKFDNITSSNYIESNKTLKTVTLVAGEGEGINRKMVEVISPSGGGIGVSRREKFTDASGVSSSVNGGTLSPADYSAQLNQKGLDDLAQSSFITSFEGKVDTTQMYKYGEDFFMGDILQIINEYEMTAKTRVIELIRFKSDAGEEVRPTFAAID